MNGCREPTFGEVREAHSCYPCRQTRHGSGGYDKIGMVMVMILRCLNSLSWLKRGDPLEWRSDQALQRWSFGFEFLRVWQHQGRMEWNGMKIDFIRTKDRVLKIHEVHRYRMHHIEFCSHTIYTACLTIHHTSHISLHTSHSPPYHTKHILRHKTHPPRTQTSNAVLIDAAYL